jgi:hypothetical protein
MKSRWLTMLSFGCFSLLGVPLAQAQVCLLSNASLSGSYGFVASEAGAIPATTGTTTTGTTTASSGYSTTEIGSLLGAIAAGNQFSLSGILTFDGAGNIGATSSPSGGITQAAGSYSVNPDCSVSVSLTDSFGTNVSPVKLAGIILQRGIEVDLTSVSNLNAQTVTAAGTPSTATGTTIPGTATGEGLTVKLVQLLFRNGCSIATLGGLYGFVLYPDQVQPDDDATEGTDTPTPTTVLGYLFFNGLGGIIPQPITPNYSSIGSVYSSLAFTGTYTVNTDCTGTLSISSSSTSTSGLTSTTTPNQTLTMGFVISPATFSGQAGNTSPGAFSGGPVLNLSFSTSSASGWGYADPE